MQLVRLPYVAWNLFRKVALVALPLASSSCGGGSPATPQGTTAPVPTPSTPAGSGGCALGKGDAAASCGRSAPQFGASVMGAIDGLVAARPDLFDKQDESEPGSGQFKVRSEDDYLDGVIDRLRGAGFCADRAINRENIQLKSSNDFSEEWDIISSAGYIRRDPGAYRQSCTPAAFPVDPSDLVAEVRVGFFSYECQPGVTPPDKATGWLRVGCDGFVTATPKLRDGHDVPPWIHGTDIRWELREGQSNVLVEDDPRFGNVFNKYLHPTGQIGGFIRCATVLGKVGCLNGRTVE